MNNEDFEKTLYNEFIELGGRMLEMYDKAPQNNSYRKIIGATDNKGLGNVIMFFQGNEQDAFAVREFLNNRKTKKEIQ